MRFIPLLLGFSDKQTANPDYRQNCDKNKHERSFRYYSAGCAEKSQGKLNHVARFLCPSRGADRAYDPALAEMVPSRVSTLGDSDVQRQPWAYRTLARYVVDVGRVRGAVCHRAGCRGIDFGTDRQFPRIRPIPSQGGFVGNPALRGRDRSLLRRPAAQFPGSPRVDLVLSCPADAGSRIIGPS